MERIASLSRTTKETDIAITLNLDGSGKADISTGIGFFDHMLNGFSRHGLFDLTCQVKGDLEVDCHHTIEDTGIVLGQVIREAVEIKRASSATAPAFCPWMSPWCFVPWICPADPITSPTWNSLRKE